MLQKHYTLISLLTSRQGLYHLQVMVRWWALHSSCKKHSIVAIKPTNLGQVAHLLMLKNFVKKEATGFYFSKCLISIIWIVSRLFFHQCSNLQQVSRMKHWTKSRKVDHTTTTTTKLELHLIYRRYLPHVSLSRIRVRSSSFAFIPTSLGNVDR